MPIAIQVGELLANLQKIIMWLKRPITLWESITCRNELSREGDDIVAIQTKWFKENKALHGLTRTLINKHGRNAGHEKILVNGVGYRVMEAGWSNLCFHSDTTSGRDGRSWVLHLFLRTVNIIKMQGNDKESLTGMLPNKKAEVSLSHICKQGYQIISTSYQT